VVSFNGTGYQALPDQYFVGTAKDITQPCGAFEVQILRCFKHLSAQTIEQVFTFTTKERADLFDNFGVFRRVNTTSAGARATIEVQAQTWFRRFRLWWQSANAGTNWEHLL